MEKFVSHDRIEADAVEKFVSEIRFQMEYQESILQNVRSSHLVFQGLFIAICIAILIFMGSTIVSSQFLYDIRKHKYEFMFHVFAFLLIMFTNYIAIGRGVALNKRYADMIEKRGRVVDFVHHFALLCSMGRISSLAERGIWKIGHPADDFDFTRKIKILERILECPLQDYESFVISASHKDVLKLDKPEYGLIKYIGLYGDIYQTDYFENENFKRCKSGNEVGLQFRNVSSSRRGHYDEFNAIWHALSGATMFVAAMPVVIWWLQCL